MRIISTIGIALGAFIAATPGSAQLLGQAHAPAPTGMSGYNYSGRMAITDCRSDLLRCTSAADSRDRAELIRSELRRGSPAAMRAVGLLYWTGRDGVARDPAEAVSWFYEAALHRDAPSMYALGRAFADGTGVAPDPALSRFWLQRAAAAGYAPARRSLASD